MTSSGPSPIAAPVLTGAWRQATVRSVAHPNAHAVVLRLEITDRIQHVPGQHYVIRLSAEDGYVAQRSYSIASAPSDPLVEFYIEKLPDGEVSSFLAEAVEVGDALDVRGPIGGWFVWDATQPLVGIAGGSGVVPFIAMQRHASDVGRPGLLSLAVSARTRAELPYRDELEAAGAIVTVTREGEARRLAPADLAPLVQNQQFFYACGSARFTSAATSWLQELGVASDAIRLESFGPSG